MQTLWAGFGYPSLTSGNSGSPLEGLVPQSCPLVLPDNPGGILSVTLPAGTHEAWLWAVTERVWYILDSLPGTIPPPTQGGVLPASVFVPGAILMPDQLYALPMDATESHTLHLSSQAMNPTVYVTLWTESF